ncbi:MAG: M67 family metallopeptidase [Chloroflexota bacterium]|nr:M67 family metallopeptidase [Chloroflexota bacterium]
MTVRLGKLLQSRIFEQMEDTYPNEGGGFLLGELEDNSAIIRDIIQVDNVFEEEEQYHRYAMTPQDWMRLEDEADDRGLTLVGYYHSHPDSPAIPSEYDREHALPNFLYIITSVEMGRATDMRVWKLRADRSVFDREELDVLEIN